MKRRCAQRILNCAYPLIPRFCWKSLFSAFILLHGCSPHSSHEFHREGNARCQTLISDLEKIQNREQLVRAESQLKKHFESLIELMIEARLFQQKHPDDTGHDPTAKEEDINRSLEKELRRIYAIEGAREIVERTQHEALIRFDAFERNLIRKQQSFN